MRRPFLFLASLLFALPALAGGVDRDLTPVASPTLLLLQAGRNGGLTFSIDPAQQGPTDLALASDNPAVASVPQMITVPAGGTSDAKVVALGPGNATITVTMSGGASITIPVNIALPSRPELTSLFPAAGSIAGGTRLTLAGAGFESSCTVLIGSSAATEPSISDPHAIVATSPPNAAGPVPVTVNCGDFSTTLTNAFTYIAPRRRATR